MDDRYVRLESAVEQLRCSIESLQQRVAALEAGQPQVAGPAMAAAGAELRGGDRLDLVREPDNPYDPNAVRVDWQGWKLGYLPRRENLAVARRLDRGEAVEARISRLSKSRNPWKRVQIDVLLPVAPE